MFVRLCNTLQHTATHCKLQHTAKHCNRLQHTATHCNTLRRTATHCDTLQERVSRGTSFWRISRFDVFDILASAQSQRSWSFTQLLMFPKTGQIPKNLHCLLWVRPSIFVNLSQWIGSSRNLICLWNLEILHPGNRTQSSAAFGSYAIHSATVAAELAC